MKTVLQFYSSSLRDRFLHPVNLPMKRIVKLASCVLIVLSCAPTLSLQAASFEDGIEAYQAGDFEAARTHFEAALQQEESGAVQHNLALTLFQLGEPAQAAWHIERASLLAPLKAEYRYKIGALRQQLGLFEQPVKWYEIAAQILSTKVWVILATISFWILVSACLLPWVSHSRVGLSIKALRLIACVLLLCSTTAVWLNYQLTKRGLVVSTSPTSLHAAPASASPETGQARPGERGEIQDRYKQYYQIETEAGAIGWVSINEFRPLTVN